MSNEIQEMIIRKNSSRRCNLEILEKHINEWVTDDVTIELRSIHLAKDKLFEEKKVWHQTQLDDYMELSGEKPHLNDIFITYTVNNLYLSDEINVEKLSEALKKDLMSVKGD